MNKEKGIGKSNYLIKYQNNKTDAKETNPKINLADYNNSNNKHSRHKSSTNREIYKSIHIRNTTHFKK